MMEKEEVIAVFDIGMTNKKFLVFNKDFKVAYQEECRMDMTTDEDGEEAEDLPALMAWIKVTFEQFLASTSFVLKGLNVSTHGASLVYTDGEGKPVAPLYSYLKKVPQGMKEEFFERYGSQKQFLARTASPLLGMLNSGWQLYWLKHYRPNAFSHVSHCLHLPQFCAWLLSGKMHSEMTSIGCHTFFWDFQQQQYHPWVEEEGLQKLLPPIAPSDHTDEIKQQGQTFKAGIGIHDSSAALIPYLIASDEPFIMLSTGTWSIAMNPFNPEPLTETELSKDCLSYLDYRGKPVKSARVFLGNEYEFQEKRLAEFFGKEAGYHKNMQFDAGILKQLLEKLTPSRRFYPQKMEGTGPFPKKQTDLLDLQEFENYEEAFHQLMLDLVGIQVASLKIIEGSQSIKRIYLSGGFTSNHLFGRLLSLFLPHYEICLGEISRATALGAALAISPEWHQNLKENLIFQRLKVDTDINLDAYLVPF